MIWHFLRRDFLSHRFQWSLLILGVCVSLPFIAIQPETLNGLGYGFFLFALISLGSLGGSKWRNQQMISRAYLLALPVARKYQFVLVQIRAFVFFLPFFLYLLMAPHYSLNFQKIVAPAGANLWLYSLMVFATLVWQCNAILMIGLGFERITALLRQSERALMALLATLFFGAQSILVVLCFIYRPLIEFNPLAPLLIIFGLTGFQYYRTRKMWLS